MNLPRHLLEKNKYIRNYHNKVIEHFERPLNGSFDSSNIQVGTGLVGAPAWVDRCNEITNKS